jgi:hypothetical protein
MTGSELDSKRFQVAQTVDTGEIADKFRTGHGKISSSTVFWILDRQLRFRAGHGKI